MLHAIRLIRFVAVGGAFLAHWLLTDPNFDGSAFQTEWLQVLAFNGAIGRRTRSASASRRDPSEMGGLQP